MRKYSFLLGVGTLLLLSSCDKTGLEPVRDQIILDRLFHETANDSTNVRDWDKHKYLDDENPINGLPNE